MAAWYYILIFGILLPYLAIKQFLKPPETSDKPDSSRTKLVGITLISLAVMGGLAVFYARVTGVELFAPWKFSIESALVGAMAVFVLLGARALLLPWLTSDPRRKPSRIISKTWNEFPSWLLISAFAGFWEEIVYRGVLYQFIAYVGHSNAVAFIATCFAFAAAHLYQGIRGFIFIFVLAALFQWLVYYTGTIFVAMAVHFLYDALIGLFKVIETQKEKPALEIS